MAAFMRTSESESCKPADQGRFGPGVTQLAQGQESLGSLFAPDLGQQDIKSAFVSDIAQGANRRQRPLHPAQSAR